MVHSSVVNMYLLLQVAAWTIGEYGDLLLQPGADDDDPLKVTEFTSTYEMFSAKIIIRLNKTVFCNGHALFICCAFFILYANNDIFETPKKTDFRCQKMK